MSSSSDLSAAFAAFAARIDALAPGSGPAESVTLSARPAVLRAMASALEAYRDPRDHGWCDQCGSGLLDETFTCTSCGQPQGLFGQLVRERFYRSG